MFEEQVEKTPDNVALIGSRRHVVDKKKGGENKNTVPLTITYRELNEQSQRLARQLREKGVKNDTIVALMVKRSLEMVIAVFGILKSGGAYMPIDPGNPRERTDYMLADSSTAILLTTREMKTEITFEKEIIYINEFEKEDNHEESLNDDNKSDKNAGGLHNHGTPGQNSLAYVIYTSGTTGTPKGVLIEHRSVVNVLTAMQERYPLREADTYLLKTFYIFDVSVTELFGWYHGGGRLAILEEGGEKDPQKILNALRKEDVTHINFVPSMFNVFIEALDRRSISKCSALRYIFIAGEELQPEIVAKFNHCKTGHLIQNIYGPTEATIYATAYSLAGWKGTGRLPIGKPLPGIKLYVQGKYGRLQPVGVPGELCIAGICLAWGYLNKPELTAKKFAANPHHREQGADDKQTFTHNPPSAAKLYHTGDLVRWLSDGNIEYLGRIDRQVKIRGYRIELGEIENRLLQKEEIKEAVVMDREDINGNKYLCAYVIYTGGDSNETTGTIENNTLKEELKHHLSNRLPEYMVPAFYVFLKKIPLTPNGKADRRALPAPELKGDSTYIAPRDSIEKKLSEIWLDLLEGKRKQTGKTGTVGIDENFFRMGGHSLSAAILMTRIHKAFDVRMPLAEVFKTPTIRGLAVKIKKTGEDKYTAIEPVEKKEYYEMSPPQKRLYILQQMDRRNTVYNMPQLIPVEAGKNLELDLRRTIRKLIQRHESLRTSFFMQKERLVQKVHHHDEIKISIENYNRIENEQEAGNRFIRPFDLSKPPLMRAGLVEIGGTTNTAQKTRNILMIDMHHIITDGESNRRLVKDFIALQSEVELPGLYIQYKDYSQWRNSPKEQERLKRQEAYWKKQFEGEIPVLEIPIDYSRPAIQRFEGNTIEIEISAATATALKTAAMNENVTLFMMLLTLANIYLSKLTGQEDIVIGTPVAGRGHADLEQVIGMFVNTLALRNKPTGEKTVKQFLAEVKNKTLEAFENQDYPFEQLVNKIEVNRDAGRNPL
ncbi:MAG: amino acid adenylation domain-containing protein, partial [bacterium]|nr:amino acid adenylation domain-containing protein [bacterium]